MNYYPEVDLPERGSRLTIIWDRPPVTMPGPIMVESRPGPRTRLIVEGEADYLSRISDHLKPLLAELREEINA